MPGTPTPEQQEFIELYITGARKRDAKMTKAFLEFDRRRDKVAKAISVLDPTDPERARLQLLLDSAIAKGHGPEDRSAPNFEGAYRDLDGIKRDARAKAKGFLKTHSPKAIARELDAMEASLQKIQSNMALSSQTMTIAIQDVSKATPAQITEPEVEDFLQDVNSREAGWRGMVASSDRLTRTAEQALADLDPTATVARIRHALQQVSLAGDNKTKAQALQLTQRLATLETQAKFRAPRFMTAERVRQPYLDQVKSFEAELVALKGLPKRELRPDTGDRFAHLEEREQQILGIALNRYHRDYGNDQLALNPSLRLAPQRPKTPPVLRQFQLDDVVDDQFAGLKEEDLDTNSIENHAQQVQDNMLQLIWDEAKKPNSDVLFDMALQNLNGLRLSIGAQLGLGPDVTEWPETMRRLVETTATKIREVIDENLPNKVSDDTVTITHKGQDHAVPRSVELDGQSYDSPELLGVGGKGKVMRYRLAGGGEDAPTVVVKATLSETSDQFMSDEDLQDDLQPFEQKSPEVRGHLSRAEMVQEAKIHRLVCGGEDGEPSPHVVGLKGMATGKGGALFMVMEEAKSGDVDQMSKAVLGLVRSGVLPKGAQQALMQDTMLQAAKGLKALQDIGLLHNDVKTMNFFLDDDGTVKIADFGSGQTLQDGQEGEAPETTERFMAPEFFRGRDERSDVFMLGTMLHNMDAPYGSEGTFGDYPRSAQFATSAPTGHNATSLDRLRNAMMQKDPTQRPTLEGVLMSSCLNSARDTYGDPESSDPQEAGDSTLTPLRLALTAYMKMAGREVAAVMQELGDTMALYRQKELNAQKYPNDVPEFEQAKQDLPGQLKGFQDRLDEIHSRDDIAPLLQALKQAGEPFGTAPGKERDRAWDFAYAKTQLAMDEIGDGTHDTSRQTGLPQNLKEELENATER